jgi:hypothetical protein
LREDRIDLLAGRAPLRQPSPRRRLAALGRTIARRSLRSAHVFSPIDNADLLGIISFDFARHGSLSGGHLLPKVSSR